MGMRSLLLVVCALAAVQGAGAVPPGQPGTGAAGGMAATRGVAKYLQLERGLQDAIEAHDLDAVKRLLADDFEARPAPGSDAIAADAWLASQMRSRRGDARVVRELGLREFDDLALVSFESAPETTAGSPNRGAILFVLDVWRTSTGRLLLRYTDRERAVARPAERPSGRE